MSINVLFKTQLLLLITTVYSFAAQMRKELVKYLSLLFILLQVGPVHLGAENIDFHFSILNNENPERVSADKILENEFSLAPSLPFDTENWQLVFSKFEQGEEEETEAESSSTSHHFTSFLNSCTHLLSLRDKLPTHHFYPSFHSLYLQFQVFRL